MSAPGWVAGEFVAASPMTDGTTVRTRVAGWINHPFAIDYRRLEDDDGDCTGGWALTHIPTGYCVQKLQCALPMAMEIAEKVRAMGPWDFTAPEDCKPYQAPMKKLRKELGSINATDSEAVGPMGSFGLLA